MSGHSCRSEAATRPGRVVDIVCLVVLALIVVSQLIRPSPRDAAIFTGLFAITLLGALGALPLPRFRLPESHRGIVVAESVLAVGLIAAGLALVIAPRSGPVDFGVVAALGVVAAPLVWGRRDDLAAALDVVPDGERVPLSRAGLAWAALAATLGLWELGAFLLGFTRTPDPPPAVSDLVDPLMNGPLTRAAVVVVWLLVGRELTRLAWLSGSRGPAPAGRPGPDGADSSGTRSSGGGQRRSDRPDGGAGEGGRRQDDSRGDRG